MDMGVEDESLPPGVQHRCHPRQRPKKLPVGGKGLHCLRDCLEKQGKENFLVGQSQLVEFFRHSEDGVKVSHVQYAAEPALNPGLPLHGPTFGTAAATAAVVADAREPAGTGVLMATQGCCPTVQDGIDGLVLVLVKRIAAPEAGERVREDVLYLKGST
jgi:hypothetical protein